MEVEAVSNGVPFSTSPEYGLPSELGLSADIGSLRNTIEFGARTGRRVVRLLPQQSYEHRRNKSCS
jgi:hypothetical protein